MVSLGLVHSTSNQTSHTHAYMSARRAEQHTETVLSMRHCWRMGQSDESCDKSKEVSILT